MKIGFPVAAAVICGAAFAGAEQPTAQSSTNSVAQLGTIVVTAGRIMPFDPNGIEDGIGYFFRESGAFGAARDMYVRGSSFSQAGIVLNGMPLNNPQTEHFNANLTLPARWMSVRGAVDAGELFRRSGGHAVGSVVADLAEPGESGGSVGVGGGLGGLMYGEAQATQVFELENGAKVWAAGAVEAAHADRTDGYDDNGLTRDAATARIGARGGDVMADVLASAGRRKFGARGYYGTAERYPAEEETFESMVLATLKYSPDGVDRLRLSAGWSRLEDTYWLDRHNHEFYENEHTSDRVMLHADGRAPLGEVWFADWRAESNLDLIRSSSLGNHSRQQGAVALMPGVKLGDWEVSAGGGAEFFSEYAPRWCPAAAIAWNRSETSRISLSFRDGLRQPSYTELNYESPDSLGNRGLGLERAHNLVFNWREDWNWVETEFEAFYTRSDGAVDWLKATSAARWVATELGRVHIYGATAKQGFKLTEDGRWKLGFREQVLVKDTDVQYWASRYSLDWPCAGFETFLRAELTDSLTVKLIQGFEVYRHNRVRRGGDVRYVSGVSAEWEVYDGWIVNVSLRDLIDQRFEIYPGQKALGFMAAAGLTYTW